MREENKKILSPLLLFLTVDRKRNCYSCRDFRYLVRNCRNRGRIGQERRIEYGDNLNNRQRNLNGEKNLIVLD